MNGAQAKQTGLNETRPHFPLQHRYLHGPAVDQILADEAVSSTATPGNVLWPLTDNLGTVRDLVDFNETTTVSQVVNHLTYDAYGRITAETNAAIDHLFAYTGRDRDEESGLHYYRARYYDPVSGRFLAQDPIGFDADDPNLYRYVWNRPVDRLDPFGLQGYGHHYFPLSVLYDLFAEGKITSGALKIGEGYYTGPTSPDHCFTTYGGLTHDEYNKLIREEFNNAGHSKRKPMNADKMTDFINNKIRNSENPRIKNFLADVEKQRQDFLKNPGRARPPETLTKQELLNRGRNFRTSKHYLSARLASVFSALATTAIAEAQGFASTCAESAHFRRAVQALSQGDQKAGLAQLYGSYRPGGPEGVYDDLLANGHGWAALRFVKYLDDLVERINNEQYSGLQETN